MTDAPKLIDSLGFLFSKVNSMKYDFNDSVEQKEVRKEIKVFEPTKIIKLNREEAKERILYKDSEGNCLIVIDGKEYDGIILSLSSNGEISIGVKNE